MKFNIACRSGTIDRVLAEVDSIFLKRPIKKTLYESDVSENPIEITLIPIEPDYVVTPVMIPILKAIPGVIFIEPAREEVITYDIDA